MRTRSRKHLEGTGGRYRLIGAALCVLSLLAGVAQAGSHETQASDIVLPNVEIRPDVTVDVHL